ncbi:Type IV secretory system Conjugative DNA transfer [Hungatella hathewayi]|uniref:Type IV secretory system Conjugative DNA transfer n=1 Tax=Hungatella hathewayi TaxID=154046 RepID=A0A6N3I0X9_9FIRM|nr:type IV secretory system conjugative DNA transfer family protein [Enterocloster clostridioformis]
MSDKIRKYVLPNLPYLFVFWFFSKVGTAYRMAAGAGFDTKLIGMMKTFPTAFENYLPGLGGLDLLIGLAGAVGMYLLVQSKIRKGKKFRREEEYGSARWGTAKDIKPFVDPVFKNNVILTGTEFLTLNTRPKIPANARNLNACVIGSSGSGKTRFWLTPQLLQAHSSYVVVDPKGGTLEQCGRFLQRQGYRLRVFNTIDFSKSMHYNPLAYIKTESDVLKFVTALIANTKGDGKDGDEFWTKAETLLYCALVAYIVFEGPEEERNMNTLVEMINSMEVREDDESFKNAVDYMFHGLEKRNPNHFAVRQYKKYKLASGKTAKSILISCGARLAPFDIGELREIMSYDELGLDTLGDEKTALFFLISDTNTTYNFLVALAFSTMFNMLCERADNKYGGRLPHHVRVLWDEAANTGQVPGLEKIVAVIRSREISLTLFYQAMSQCKALYKDNAETIMGNMDSIVFLGGREASTLKDISENWLGKATISMQTESRTRGQSESYGQNMQRLGRELLTTSEITTMPGNMCICQLRGLPPFYSPKYDLKKHPSYHQTAEYDKKKNAFRLETLFRHRPLRLKPKDEYTVYEIEETDAEEEADILNFDDMDSDDFA